MGDDSTIGPTSGTAIAIGSPSADVSTPIAAYEAMAKKWRRIDDLLGGTQTMREAGTRWLPKHPGEKPKEYSSRLRRAVLYNKLQDAIDDCVARPFSEPLSLKGGELPMRLKALEKNADKMAATLSGFFRDCFWWSIARGLLHVLIDFPAIGRLNLKQEVERDIRPYFVLVDPIDLIGWRYKRDVDGSPVLTQIRIRESIVVPDGAFGERSVERVRLINAPVRNDIGEITQQGSWQIWERGETSRKFVVVQSGFHNFPRIPLRTLYTCKTGFMQADPAFDDLAWLNVSHWQNSADQEWITHVARVPILFESGVTEEEAERPKEIGPTRCISSTNPDADMKFVEHSGQAIGAGKAHIDDIERRMSNAAREPFVRRTGNQTATARAMDEVQTHVAILEWVRDLETFARDCIVDAGEWIGEKITDDLKVNVFSEFSLSMRATEDLQELGKARERGDLSRTTYLGECKRRGLLSEDFDVQEENERIAEEGPPLSMLMERKPSDPKKEPDDEGAADAA